MEEFEELSKFLLVIQIAFPGLNYTLPVLKNRQTTYNRQSDIALKHTQTQVAITCFSMRYTYIENIIAL